MSEIVRIILVKTKTQLYALYMKCTLNKNTQINCKQKNGKRYPMQNSRHKKVRVPMSISNKVDFKVENNRMKNI